MDDKTRRVGGPREDPRENEKMTGRTEETTRNLSSTTEGATERPAGTPRATSTTRRGTSGSRRTTTPETAAAGAEGLDRETDERTRELQAEIADTREELSETIEAIQERLRPGTIMSNATDSVKEKALERVRDLADTAGERASGMMRDVKHNPVPALMIGAGVAWLLLDRSRRESGSGYRASGYRTNYRAATGFDFDNDEPAYSDVDAGQDDWARRGLTGSVSERASDLTRGARDRWQRTTRGTTNGLQRLMRDNPLLVGAAAVLVGAAVGAALPETERENQLMGETRDTVVNQAQEMAQNAASTVKEVASNIPAQVTDAVASQVTGAKP